MDRYTKLVEKTSEAKLTEAPATQRSGQKKGKGAASLEELKAILADFANSKLKNASFSSKEQQVSVAMETPIIRMLKDDQVELSSVGNYEMYFWIKHVTEWRLSGSDKFLTLILKSGVINIHQKYNKNNFLYVLVPSNTVYG